MSDYYTNINPVSLTNTQSQAVKSTNNRIAVIAGPGSGKTRVLTERIIYLIKENNIPENQILALSFSSKAAKEMRNRLVERLGVQANKIAVKTFHSFGLQIIRNNYDTVNLSENFDFIDNTGKNRILRKIMKANRIPEKDIVDLSQTISKIKCGFLTVDYQTSKTFNEYQTQLKLNNMIDFDDMIILALKILHENEDISRLYQSEYSHVLVDEVQDLNRSQIEIINHIIDDSTSLFIVGDDDQCIYEWRGAEPDFLKNLEKNSGFEIIRLEENFRSDSKIVDISGVLINHNVNRIGKRMHSGKLKKKNINLNALSSCRFSDSYCEARFIADEIEKLSLNGQKYNSIAVLVRKAPQAVPIKSALEERDIHYFEQVSDLTDYDEFMPVLYSLFNLKKKNSINKAINFPYQIMDNFFFMDLQEEFNLSKELSVYDSFEELSHKKFENSDIFRKRFDTLVYLSKNYPNMKMSEIIQMFYDVYADENSDNLKITEKIEHVKTLIDIAKDFDNIYQSDENGSPLSAFLDYIKLSSQDESAENIEYNGVNIMTCHKSKGLEFPIVFIPGVQVGVFPNDYFVHSKEDVESERRLFYVSMTRAIDKLYLTCYADPFCGKGYVEKGFMAEIPGISIK